MIQHDFKVEVVDAQDNLEFLNRCARTCYMSEPKGDPRTLLRSVIAKGHTSVLEHLGIVQLSSYDDRSWKYVYGFNRFGPDCSDVAVMNARTAWMQYSRLPFNVSDQANPTNEEINRFLDAIGSAKTSGIRPCFLVTCDRAVSHELVRHRTLSFSQESQRYVSYGDDDELDVCVNQATMPDGFSELIETEAVDMSHGIYKTMVEAGTKPQTARMVLPNMTRTRVMVSGWCWEWMWFLDLRDDKAAHPDMRLVAKQIGDLLETSGKPLWRMGWWRANREVFDRYRQQIPSVWPEWPTPME